MPQAPDFPRLGRYVERRIDELGREYKEVASEARISIETLSKIRRARPVSPRSYRKLEPALGWETYSMDHILDGEEPTASHTVISAERKVDGVRSTVSTAVLTDKMRDLPVEEQQELIDELAQIAEMILKRRHRGPDAD